MCQKMIPGYLIPGSNDVSTCVWIIKIINTSYQKLPFGSGDDSDKTFFVSENYVAPWFLRVGKRNFGMVVLHGNVKKLIVGLFLIILFCRASVKVKVAENPKIS